MGWPQWVLLVLMVLTCLGYFIKDGKPREDWQWEHGIINFALSWWLLWMGGFWS